MASQLILIRLTYDIYCNLISNLQGENNTSTKIAYYFVNFVDVLSDSRWAHALGYTNNINVTENFATHLRFFEMQLTCCYNLT